MFAPAAPHAVPLVTCALLHAPVVVLQVGAW
jgi:hypothetical protein